MNESPSIGKVGSIGEEPRHARSKGTILKIHTNIREVAETLSDIVASCRNGTRLTVRLILGREIKLSLIPLLVNLYWQGVPLRCEALIPVQKGAIGAIAYFGANTPKRNGDCSLATIEMIRQRELGLIDMMLAKERKSKEVPQRFRVELLERATDCDKEDLLCIYETSYDTYIVDFTPQTIEGMLRNNVVAVARNAQHIVAVSQAEIVHFRAGDEAWKLIELSDYAADPGYSGNGFVRLCNEALIRKLAGERTIIYSETTAHSLAALRSNPECMQMGGFLPQHCRMTSSFWDVPVVAGQADLCVLYLPQGK